MSGPLLMMIFALILISAVLLSIKDAATSKTCAACKGSVPRDASKCRHCGSAV